MLSSISITLDTVKLPLLHWMISVDRFGYPTLRSLILARLPFVLGCIQFPSPLC
ncbi:hypothetical protein IC575_013056 [Cucumis melo]